MNTLEEIVEQLKQIDEVTLIEMLRLTSEDIVDRCRDLIEDDYDRYSRELQQFFGDETEETEDN